MKYYCDIDLVVKIIIKDYYILHSFGSQVLLKDYYDMVLVVRVLRKN